MKKRLIILFLVGTVVSAGLSYLFFHIDLVPYPSSQERTSIDTILKIMFGIASFFFGLIATFLVYILLFFRRRRGDASDGTPLRGYAPLEVTWAIIPLVIVVALAVYATGVLNKMGAPAPATEPELKVDVLAFRFGWQFSYPEYGVQSFELGVPINRRVLFQIQSKDVVHAFWVQEWGPKQDAVPGMTTELRITPTRVGTYLVECSQLCGASHTYMTAPVSVMTETDFESWVKKQPKIAPATPAATASPTSLPVTNIDLVAKNNVFNLSTITVPAGADITVNFDNQDSLILHNFAAYTDASATSAIYVGKIITGQATTTYQFNAPATPGTYFFRCDAHPMTMTGTLVVK